MLIRTAKRSLVSGVTLIELIIVIAIVALLASIALPSYNNFVQKSRRADGASEVSRIMQQQERFFLNNMRYTADLTELGYASSPVTSQEGFYSIAAAACAGAAIARCVLLTATAQGGQSSDGALTLNSRGEKTRKGNSGWDH